MTTESRRASTPQRAPRTDHSGAGKQPSRRESELLDRAYAWVLEHGLGNMSLRPLAEGIGSSPRVLLFLFGSKDGLTRALLARARASELTLLEQESAAHGDGMAAATAATWQWLSAPAHRPLLALWVEAYGNSLVHPDGPWGDFARETVTDWLAVLALAQPPRSRRTKRGLEQRTLALAVLRGAMLDVLATGDTARASSAVDAYVATLVATTDDQSTGAGS